MTSISGVVFLREQQVGAAAQNELVGGLHFGPHQQLAQLVGRGEAGEVAGPHVEAKGVVGAEGDVFFEERHHAAKVAARALGGPMPLLHPYPTGNRLRYSVFTVAFTLKRESARTVVARLRPNCVISTVVNSV